MVSSVVFVQFVFCLIFMVKLCTSISDDFDPNALVLPDDVIKVTFPRQCAAGEAWKSEQSTGKKLSCAIPKGHLIDEINQFLDNAQTLGCPVDKQTVAYIGKNFDLSKYASNPIYQRVTDDCGYCGIKPACCGTVNAESVAKKVAKDHPDLDKQGVIVPFYYQSFSGQPCSEKSGLACSYKPLTPEEFDQLAKLQPYTKNIDRSNDCNFAQFGMSEWEELRTNPVFPAYEALFNKINCHVEHTTKLRYNCVKNPETKMCMCCCFNNYPITTANGKWVCIPKTTENVDSICLTT